MVLPARATLILGVLLVLGGCSRGSTQATKETRPVAPAPPPTTEPAVGASAAPAPEEADPAGSSFEADPRGQASDVLRADAPNLRYAKLDRRACEAELQRRAIPVEHAKGTPGVVTPVWLRGPLHGVSVHSGLSPKARERSSVELFDCRLVLALDDFAAQLAAHDVVEIVHMSAFRPPSSRGCTPKYRGKQHCAALAVDVGSFKKKDGSMLVVERDFHGKIGLPTCAGAGPRTPAAEASELWSFVCDAAKRATFNVILTPNYNAQHYNHFHLEITPGVKWMLIK